MGYRHEHRSVLPTKRHRTSGASGEEHQYRSWIGLWGGINDARIVLAERAAGGERVISSWSPTSEAPL
jgi:hypothetical protein